ncbi:hypothetical protein AOLI_G00161840 [Acnodon oligacanthus]
MPKYEELPSYLGIKYGFQCNDPWHSNGGKRWRATCVWNPSWELPCCRWLRCASDSSAASPLSLLCHCEPQGSLSVECNKVGGQCRCKPNRLAATLMAHQGNSVTPQQVNAHVMLKRKCVDGFYGNQVLDSEENYRPCPSPGCTCTTLGMQQAHCSCDTVTGKLGHVPAGPMLKAPTVTSVPPTTGIWEWTGAVRPAGAAHKTPSAPLQPGLVLESNSVLSASCSTGGIQTCNLRTVGVTRWVQRLFSVTAPQGHVCAERT